MRIDSLALLFRELPIVSSSALTCAEGGRLEPKDIMIEVDPFDLINGRYINCKDLHVRVWAHDYPARRGADLSELKAIRKRIATTVITGLEEGMTWYVWVLLATTSYGSDTMDD